MQALRNTDSVVSIVNGCHGGLSPLVYLLHEIPVRKEVYA